MNVESQQLSFVQRLLKYIARKAQDPEAFKLFTGGFLHDMASRTKARPVLDSRWNIGFRCVLCQNDTVLAVALPYAIRDDGKETPLHQWEEEALRAAGIPLFADLLVETAAENGEKALSLKSPVRLESSAWSFPTVAIGPEVKDHLVKKGLVLQDNNSGLIPSPEGKELGLCTVYWHRSRRFSRMKSLSCSTAGWLYRLWAPRVAAPLWKTLPLDTRLERMQSGRAGNPGHTASTFKRLDAMPLEPLLLEGINERYLEENLSQFQMLYKPGVTYGQAARDVDKWMRSEREEVRKMGTDSLDNLTALFCTAYNLRKSERDIRKDKEKITAIHNKTHPAGRSLSARLTRAGVSENACRYLPLAGDDLEDVFQGLSVLLGTDDPAQSFYRDVLPRIMPDWDRSEGQKEQWDGTFDGLIAVIYKNLSSSESRSGSASDLESGSVDYAEFDLGPDPEFDPNPEPEPEPDPDPDSELLFDDPDPDDPAPPRLDFWYQAAWQLLIEPFCLLDQARKLEDERGRLLEGFQAWNEQLKQELEGMDFDGNVH